mmetsp:Transcript_3419/g.13952  ORF Transcript_3419/g.13952 Transcript_3419/m.13952 type:complete len:219 (+) Transcript_3419:233-889(+)
MGRGRFESRAPCSRRDVAPTGPRRPRPHAPNRSSGDARCRFSATTVHLPGRASTRRNRKARFGAGFGESSRTRTTTTSVRTSVTTRMSVTIRRRRRTRDGAVIRRSRARTTAFSNPPPPRRREGASSGGSSSFEPPRRGATRVSRRRMTRGMGRTRGANTRGTWSRMCSRDLLFPRRSDRRARRPRGSKRERGCFPKGERGLESGGRGRRRLGGNRSV